MEDKVLENPSVNRTFDKLVRDDPLLTDCGDQTHRVDFSLAFGLLHRQPLRLLAILSKCKCILLSYAFQVPFADAFSLLLIKAQGSFKVISCKETLQLLRK